MSDRADVTRYAITHVDGDGTRVLTFANQGRNHYDTLEQAESHLEAMRQNNPASSLETITRGNADSLAVRAILCYWHGDAKGCSFNA